CYPLPVTFTNLSTGFKLHKWAWDFGDGAKSVFKNPFHNFLNIGKYDVELRVETTHGCADTILKTAYIQTSGPTADLIIEPDSGCLDQLFLLKMENIVDVARFQWDFGDGNSSVFNPATHLYTSAGMKHFKVILSDSANDCIKTLSDSVYIYDIQAQFDISETETCVNSKIQFS